MSSLKVKRPILRYHGGKWLDAPWIINHLPKHRTYVELFGGAASVLMRKPRSYAEVYNDLWDTVVNVFQVMRDRDKAAELEHALRLTPFSRTEFDICGEVFLQDLDPVEKARRTILRSFAGFGSASTNNLHSTGFRASSHRSGTTPAHDWMNYPFHIQSFTERLQGVIIEKRDYRDIIRQHDGRDTVFYADPPYVHTTRNMRRGNANYAFEMTDEGHVQLSKSLNAIQGYAVLSGYESDLYRDLYKGWTIVRKKSFADGANPRIECLFLNPRAAAEQHKLFTEKY